MRLSRINLPKIFKNDFVSKYAVVACCVFIGVAILITTKASTTTLSIEAETGSKCNTSLEKLNNTASNSKNIKFTANACTNISGGEDVRGVKGELPEYLTTAGLVNQWLESRSQADPPNGEGAFRFQCKPSHLAYDDPIVKPGQPGAMHLHLFYGNVTADGNSTYEKLRKNGAGTCEGGEINRSAYWMPALINGANKVILPDYTQVYYKIRQTEIPQLSYIPRGLRYIAGNPLDSGATEAEVYGPANSGEPGGYYQSPRWECRADNGNGEIRAVSDKIPQCQDGDRLFSKVPFPFCWHKDKLLDSDDHRTHVIFPDNYEDQCPASHPFHIPQFTIITTWRIRSGWSAQMSNWYISSDRHEGHGMYPNGKSMHADWFGAWDDPVMKRWVDNCLKGPRSANNANLCDGQGGKKPTVPVNGTLIPWYEDHPSPLVDIPAQP